MLDGVNSISEVFLPSEQECGVSSFAHRISNLRNHVEYRRCDDRKELKAIYWLRYNVRGARRLLGALCRSNCEQTRENFYQRFRFFVSSPFEQRLLFKRPKCGESVPLTVLPTAKYSLAAA